VRYSIVSEATFVYCEKMEKKEFCVLMKHCFLAKKKILLKPRLGWINIIWTLHHEWFAKYKRGKMSIEDDARSGRLKEAITEENIKKLNKKNLNDRKVKLIEIAETLKISKERVGHIVHEYLDILKLCAKWVQRVLTINQKQQRVDDSEQCLAIFNRNEDEFFCRYITMDETYGCFTTLQSLIDSQPSGRNGQLASVLSGCAWYYIHQLP
jgi:hypothetical protein